MSFPALNRQLMSFIILDPTAAEKYGLWKPSEEVTIVGLQLAVQGGFTADDTNFIKVYLYDGGTDASGTDVIGQYLGIVTAGDGDITDLKPFVDTVTKTKLDANDYLVLHYDEGGTVAPASLTVIIEYVMGDARYM